MTKKKSVHAAKQPVTTPTMTTHLSNDNLSFWEKIIPPAVLTILTTLFYYPSLRYPFQFDDLANISKKFAIRFDNPLSRWYKSPRWMGDLLNRINYEMSGFDPFSYRVFNLAIHILSGVLLFCLIVNLCKFLKSNNFLYKNSSLIAFTTSALFLLHPVQSQAVSYTIQARLEGLATLFIVAGLFLFTQAFHTRNKIGSLFLITLSGTIALLAFGTKEMIVVIPLLLLLVDWFFISDENWQQFKKRLPYYGAFAILFTIVLLKYLSFDLLKQVISLQMTVGNNKGNILTNHAHDMITAGSFLISSFKVILHYLLIFLWPFNLSVEYDWKLSENFFSPDAFFPFLILASIFSFVVYSTIKKSYKFLTFGLLWFFISIAPRSTIIPSPELICDYKTYLASIGWLFIFAVAIVHLIKYLETHVHNLPIFFKKLYGQMTVLTIFIIMLGFGLYARNKVWETPVSFWEDIVIKAPNKARGHNNLGVALSESGIVDRAIEHYQKAIELDKYYSDPLSNIAVAFSMKGENDKAISALQRAIFIFPYYPEAYNNLGTLLIKQQKYDQAEQVLKTAISLRPYYGKAHHNLGRLYLEQKDEEKALESFERATQGDLDTKEGFYTFGQLSLQLKKYDKAIYAYEQAIKRGAGQIPVVWFNLANSYFLKGDYKKAKSIFSRLIEENPTESKYIYNLGETFFVQENYEQALELFKKVTTLPNAIAQSYLRVASCLEKLKKFDEAKIYLNSLMQANAPEEFKKNIQNELTRIELQAKISSGGPIQAKDLQQFLSKTTTSTQNKPAQKIKRQLNS